ncbi:MAG: hypothetical protein GX594_07690 [Pirellulaceae bacterium]|nr:hypothetical protein [Pirellulaceae bacterium]
MKNAIIAMTTAVVLGGWFAGAAYAQKGMGDAEGVAQQTEKPECVSLTGKILEIKTGPCKSATGRSPIGTHLILENSDEQKLNIHLGPADALAEIVKNLTIGQEITVKAFRTDKHKEHHYVAVLLTYGETTIELRDDSLRPVWAQQRGSGRGLGWHRGRMQRRGRF